MGNEVQDVLNKLPGLGRTELQMVRSTVEGLLGALGEEEKTNGMDPGREVFNALGKAMEKQGPKAMSYSQFQRARDFSGFVVKAKGMMAFVEEGFKPKTKAELISALRLCWGLILNRVESFPNAPKCYRTAIQQMGNVAGIVDEAFPGYAQAGLLRVVLDQKRGRK